MAARGQLARLGDRGATATAAARRDRRERSRDTDGLRHVKLPAQRDDKLTVAFAGNGGASRLAQSACGWPPAAL
jgi:hypothetical protein